MVAWKDEAEERRGQREDARGSETEEQRCGADGVTGTDITRGWRVGVLRVVDEETRERDTAGVLIHKVA